MSKFFNVVGSDNITVELIAPDEEVGSIKSILLTNIHASNDATVKLFIQDDPLSGTTSTYNILTNLDIPFELSLLLDNPSMLRFPVDFGLYITVGASDTVDVIINT